MQPATNQHLKQSFFLPIPRKFFTGDGNNRRCLTENSTQGYFQLIGEILKQAQNTRTLDELSENFRVQRKKDLKWGATLLLLIKS